MSLLFYIILRTGMDLDGMSWIKSWDKVIQYLDSNYFLCSMIK